MAKTYELVVYDDDGKGVTSAITEYDRADGGQLTYIGRAWLDVEETQGAIAAMTDPRARRLLAPVSPSALDRARDEAAQWLAGHDPSRIRRYGSDEV